MRLSFALLALVLAGCASGTGVELQIDGTASVDQLTVVATYDGTSVTRSVPTSPHAITLPATFVAELPDSTTSVTFGVTAMKSGIVLASGVTQPIGVHAHETVHATVQLGGGAYAEAVWQDAPEVYYRLGETSGTTAVDSSGHGHDATYGASVMHTGGLVPGDPDGAALFSGGAWSMDGIVSLAPTTTLEPTAMLSVECWARPTSIDATAIDRNFVFYQGNEEMTDKEPYQLAASGDVASFYESTLAFHGGEPVTGGSLVAGAAHHLVATFDGTDAALYVDGVKVGSDHATGQIGDYDGVHGLALGGVFAGSTANVLANAVIDDVAIYATVLSPARVTAHFQAAK